MGRWGGVAGGWLTSLRRCGGVRAVLLCCCAAGDFHCTMAVGAAVGDPAAAHAALAAVPTEVDEHGLITVSAASTANPAAGQSYPPRQPARRQPSRPREQWRPRPSAPHRSRVQCAALRARRVRWGTR
jgi:hypothetical protein